MRGVTPASGRGAGSGGASSFGGKPRLVGPSRQSSQLAISIGTPNVRAQLHITWVAAFIDGSSGIDGLGLIKGFGRARFTQGAVDYPRYEYCFRSSRFSSLPAVLRGRWSTKTIFLGSL
jgi:hypothetical protein